jgi:hypothetical protein
MPQFDVNGIVEGLECNLKPHADFEGLIPEPTDRQVGEFLAGLKDAMRESREKAATRQEVDVNDPEQVARAVDEMDPEEFVRTAEVMASLYSALCSGTPTKEQILSVPRRARLAFYRWVQGEVLNPEAVTPAGKTQDVTLPQRATA